MMFPHCPLKDGESHKLSSQIQSLFSYKEAAMLYGFVVGIGLATLVVSIFVTAKAMVISRADSVYTSLTTYPNGKSKF